MNEDYLHFIWKTKRLPFHLIKTTDQKDIIIKHGGYHNENESGPDFMNGKILYDGLEWCGNIELHVKSSDWYVHKHHNDLAYNNVVLHVVYEHDRDVVIEDIIIPTIELKKHIDWKHYDYFQRFYIDNGEINCARRLPNIDDIYIQSMLERSIVDRLNRKTDFLNQDIRSEKNPSQVLYLLMARAFGTKVNQLPFEELVNRLPLSLLKQFQRTEQALLVIKTSGILEIDVSPHLGNTVVEIGHVASQSWKRKGLRPYSFPEIRVNQFALLVSKFDFNMLQFIKNSHELLSFINQLFQSLSNGIDPKLGFSQQLIDLFLINCIAPFLWWYGDLKADEEMKDRALDLLQLVEPEKNKIITLWRKVGVKSKSAYESQALLELYNEYCTKNKCLTCEIGMKILKE